MIGYLALQLLFDDTRVVGPSTRNDEAIGFKDQASSSSYVNLICGPGTQCTLHPEGKFSVVSPIPPHHHFQRQHSCSQEFDNQQIACRGEPNYQEVLKVLLGGSPTKVCGLDTLRLYRSHRISRVRRRRLLCRSLLTPMNPQRRPSCCGCATECGGEACTQLDNQIVHSDTMSCRILVVGPTMGRCDGR